MASLHTFCDPQALAERDMTDSRGEKRVVDLLAVPLEVRGCMAHADISRDCHH